MRTLPWSLVAALTLPVGCTHTAAEGKPTERVRAKRAAPKLKLPKPIPLPAEPPMALHVAEPESITKLLGPYLPAELLPTKGVELQLKRRVEAEVAKTIASAVDGSGAWSWVSLGPDAGEIYDLALRPDAVDALRETLAAHPAEGKFGAVRLPVPPEATTPPLLAWVDQERGRLSLARSLEGVATGRELAKTYGEDPIFATVDPRPFDERSPFSRLTASGRTDDLTIRATVSGEDPLAEVELEPGALTALTQHAGMAFAGSAKWGGRDKFVKQTIAGIQDQVDQLNFMVRGLASDLAKKFYAVLRNWNGAALVGIGDGHLYLALGADDPKRSGIAVLHFLRGVSDGISLARNFTDQVPGVSIKRNAGEAAGVAIHRMKLTGVKRQIPLELEPLLDDKGALRMAISSPPNTGASMMIVGPTAVNHMAQWMEATKGEAHADGDLVALMGAPTPEDAQLLALVRDEQDLADTALKLRGGGPRYQLTLRRDGDHAYVARIKSAGAGTSEGPRKYKIAPNLGAEATGKPKGKPNRGKRSGKPTSR